MPDLVERAIFDTVDGVAHIMSAWRRNEPHSGFEDFINALNVEAGTDRYRAVDIRTYYEDALTRRRQRRPYEGMAKKYVDFRTSRPDITMAAEWRKLDRRVSIRQMASGAWEWVDFAAAVKKLVRRAEVTERQAYDFIVEVLKGTLPVEIFALISLPDPPAEPDDDGKSGPHEEEDPFWVRGSTGDDEDEDDEEEEEEEDD